MAVVELAKRIDGLEKGIYAALANTEKNNSTKIVFVVYIRYGDHKRDRFDSSYNRNYHRDRDHRDRAERDRGDRDREHRDRGRMDKRR